MLLTGGDLQVTAGPLAETVEQLGGYYVVEPDDVDDLVALLRHVLDAGDVAEVRLQAPESM